MMIKKIFLSIFIPVFGIPITLSMPVFAQSKLDADLRQIGILTEVIHQIQEEYVDQDQTSTEQLVQSAIDGMLSSLDRYSVFLDPKEAQEFNNQSNGAFQGLGIHIDFVDNWLTVIEPMPGTPAAEAGMIGGDRILEIDAVSTKGLGYESASKMLQGEIGTPVTLLIKRRGEPELITKTLVRSQINTHAVEAHEKKMLDATTGYIRFRDFTQNAAAELEQSIRELQGLGMRSLIFDLRDNVGGMFDVAVDVCDLFLDEGKDIVFQKDRLGRITTYQSKKPSTGNFLLAVVVNEYSASASEIVAGCLQDYKRGILVGPAGHKTFGKGKVQTLIELAKLPGAAIKLTTAKYLTPNGRSIDDEEGLTPDIQVPVTDLQRIQIRREGKLGFVPPHLLHTNPKNMTNTAFKEESVSGDPNAEPEKDDLYDKNELYDIELYTAYQVLKGAEVFQSGGQNQYSRANPWN